MKTSSCGNKTIAGSPIPLPASVSVHPTRRRTGIGRRMIDEAERHLRAMGCPKINLQVRNTNIEVIEFYKKIGFKVDDVVSLGKRLDPD